MFAGHIAVGLALGRAEPRINVGIFVAAALWLDLALWAFVLLGWESVAIPADFASTHQPAFDFPYSHGLAASLAWSIALGASAAVGTRRIRIAAWVAAAVFSHWLLDALVHRPELPIMGAGSVAIGLGLWQHMALALGVESALVAAGLVGLLGAHRWTRGRTLALAGLTLALLAFTIVGMTIAPAPPSSQAMAVSSLVTLIVVCALYLWLGRPR